MNNIYFLIAPSGSDKILICNILKNKYNITFDKYDCATIEQIEENDLYVIDPKGVEFFKEHYNDSKQVKIIYIESDMTTRYERMKQRAEDSGSTYLEAVDDSLERIMNDVFEFDDYVNHRIQVDCTVENNNTTIENVADKIYKFITETEEE